MTDRADPHRRDAAFDVNGERVHRTAVEIHDFVLELAMQSPYRHEWVDGQIRTCLDSGLWDSFDDVKAHARRCLLNGRLHIPPAAVIPLLRPGVSASIEAVTL